MVRVVPGTDGEPWWVAKDVCDAPGFSHPSKAIERLDRNEKSTIAISTPSGNQIVTTIDEFGLNSLILTSRKPVAKSFLNRVVSVVLPVIRRVGNFPLAV